MQLHFFGGAQTVTGSRYLLETLDQTILVDCGLFQGKKDIRSLNWQPFPFNPKKIDTILLTHAHIDHSGYIPALVKQGFRGVIHCTHATFDLCKILLFDSAHLQEEDARFANKHGFSRHKPALPLYTAEDTEKALAMFGTHKFNEPFDLSKGVSVEFIEAGHILGASIIRVKAEKKTIVFSGDLGRQNDPLMHPPATIKSADYIVMESTYGDRVQDETCDPIEQLGKIINSTIARGGSVLLPSFAVERAQLIIYFIDHLKQKGVIPNIPVYVDSPMATNVTDLFLEYAGQHKLNVEDCKRIFDAVTYTRDVEESKALDHLTFPSVIISASGMLEGGRILHHLKHYLGNEKHTLVFTGYQAMGTRGQYLQSGGKNVRIHGAEYPVRAEIQELCNLSAHADANELLMWLSHIKKPPKKIFLIHGELESSQALGKAITEKLDWDVIIPSYNYTEKL